MDSLQSLKGKTVEITYQGLIYKGELIGAGETEVYIQTSTHRMSLPLSGITAVRALPKGKG